MERAEGEFFSECCQAKGRSLKDCVVTEDKLASFRCRLVRKNAWIKRLEMAN